MMSGHGLPGRNARDLRTRPGRRDRGRMRRAGTELLAYRQQLLHTVRARVPAHDRAMAPLGDGPGHLGIGSQLRQMPPHLSAVLCDEIVAAGLEQTLAIVPGRRYERDAAR